MREVLVTHVLGSTPREDVEVVISVQLIWYMLLSVFLQVPRLCDLLEELHLDSVEGLALRYHRFIYFRGDGLLEIHSTQVKLL